jgi:predicted component of type VI protein secretion system
VKVQIIITGGKVSKKDVALKLPATIGRGRDSTLSITHPMISRHHCKLFETKGLVMVRDMGSLNGTTVAGERVVEAPLPPEAEFSVGPLTFHVQYQYAGDLSALPAAKLAKPIESDQAGEITKTGLVAEPPAAAAKPTAAAKPATAAKPAAAKPAATKPAAAAAKPAPAAKPAAAPVKPAAAKPAPTAKPAAAPVKPAAARPAAITKPTIDDDDLPDFEELLGDTPALGIKKNPPAAAKKESTTPSAGGQKPKTQAVAKPAAAAPTSNVKKPAGK